MSVTAAQIVALVFGLAAAAGWAAVATSGTTTRRVWWVLVGGTVVATVGMLASVAVLWWHDWWFAADRVLTAAPLSLGALMWFAVAVAKTAGGLTPASRIAAWAGCFSAAAGVFVPFVIGAPLPALTAAAVVATVVGATLVAALLLAARRPRRPVAAVVAAVAAVIVITAGLSIAGAAAPGPLTKAHAHGGDFAQGVTASGPIASVIDLRDDATATPDVAVTLEARAETVALPSGAFVDAWTYGTLGGPALEVTVGDLVEVTLRNRDITDGVTIHWHGVPVPNGDDGVAGVTQDAVLPGDSFTYRFTATQPGTYWYHTHQRSSVGVVRGLYGSLVVHPQDAPRAGLDLTVPIHTFNGRLVFGESDEGLLREVVPGTDVRVRLINTDQTTHELTVTGTRFRVVAIDGTDAAAPGELENVKIKIPAGGRYDLGFTMPAGGVRVTDAASRIAHIGFIAQAGQTPPERTTAAGVFDPLDYGSGALPEWAHGPFDVRRTMVLDRLPRLTPDGPAYAYTVDGAVFPGIAPTIVSEGDTVEVTVVNRGFEVHPMHPHGHRVLVLEVDGRAPAAPLWLDSFDVQPGQIWRVGLVADNPGIWMDHCHNLEHAALGMVTHLAYEGVGSPFEHGGAAGNDTE